MTTTFEKAKNLFSTGEGMDVEKFAAHFCDDCFYQFANYPVAKSPKEIIKNSQEFLSHVKTVKHHIIGHHESAGIIYLEMEISYTCLNGNHHTLPCFDSIKFEGDKVKELKIFMDINPVYAEPHATTKATEKKENDHSYICDKIASMYAALKKEDWNEFESYFDENVLYKVGANDPVVGPKMITKTLQYIYKILKLTTHNQRGIWKADDETVIIEMDANYVNKLTEKFVQVPCTDIYRFENGKITEWRVYPDASQTGFTSWFNK